MASVDTAWYRMQEHDNPMMVTGLMLFDGPLDLTRLRRALEERLVGRYGRFRQRAVGPAGPLARMRWVDDPAFDLDRHLTVVDQPPDGLGPVLDRLAGTPLPVDRPLWNFTVVRGGAQGDALIARLSHAIADGVALARVTLALTDDSPEGGVQVEPPAPRQRGSRTAGAALRLVFSGLTTLPRLLALPRAPRHVLRGPLQGRRRLAWSGPVPLDDVKALGRTTGATVNDVLLDALTGALRRVLGERTGDLRAVVPVDLRNPRAPVGLGNRFGLVFLALPVGTADPVARLGTLKRRMDALKLSGDAPVLLATLAVIGVLPAPVERALVRLLGTKASLVVTNVPGPGRTVFLAGSRIRELEYWVPQSDGVGVGVSILSYAGRVTIGVSCDVGTLARPELLVDAFVEELRRHERRGDRRVDDAAAHDVGGALEGRVLGIGG